MKINSKFKFALCRSTSIVFASTVGLLIFANNYANANNATASISSTNESTQNVSNEPMELYWEDMVPKDYVVPPSAIDHNGQMTQMEPDAPLLQALNGQHVKIPGFVVPLEGDADNITEFLLVPYFGACVHVPPPPSNQIVYVKFSEGVPITNLYDAVWVTGVLSTDGWKGDIATVGYTLKGELVTAFEG